MAQPRSGCRPLGRSMNRNLQPTNPIKSVGPSIVPAYQPSHPSMSQASATGMARLLTRMVSFLTIFSSGLRPEPVSDRSTARKWWLVQHVVINAHCHCCVLQRLTTGACVLACYLSIAEYASERCLEVHIECLHSLVGPGYVYHVHLQQASPGPM